jgi:DNA-binding protein H-NS
MSKKFDLDSMSVDEMWQLYEQLSQMLSARLVSEKRELEKRLARLRIETRTRGAERASEDRPRRKYPQVFPKYRNSNPPYETWSGRGKQPRWLTAALKAGRTIEEFAIGKAESSKRIGRRRRP